MKKTKLFSKKDSLEIKIKNQKQQQKNDFTHYF